MIKLNTKNNCLICGSEEIKKYPAKISPFILERIKKEDVEISLVECGKCGFKFFDYRPEDKEMALIYNNYRDDEYQKCRQKHEPFYTKEFNDYLGKSKEELETRKRNLAVAIKEGKIDTDKIESVLDFGGDKGQHINIDIFAKQKKYVYEISDVELVPGVQKVNSIENSQFDFIVSQHVLEHVSYPMDMMKQIVSTLKNKGYFYFELPFEDFFPPMMHEHINRFNKESVQKMIELSGLELLYIDINNPLLIFGIAKKC